MVGCMTSDHIRRPSKVALTSRQTIDLLGYSQAWVRLIRDRGRIAYLWPMGSRAIYPHCAVEACLGSRPAPTAEEVEAEIRQALGSSEWLSRAEVEYAVPVGSRAIRRSGLVFERQPDPFAPPIVHRDDVVAWLMAGFSPVAPRRCAATSWKNHRVPADRNVTRGGVAK